jgi:hypothetical protein
MVDYEQVGFNRVTWCMTVLNDENDGSYAKVSSSRSKKNETVFEKH